MAEERGKKNLENFKEDKESITPKTHEQFTQMVSLINNFYKEVPFDSIYESKNEMEEAIQKFFQGDTVLEQQLAAKAVWEHLRKREIEKIENHQSVENTSIKGENTSEER